MISTGLTYTENRSAVLKNN